MKITTEYLLCYKIPIKTKKGSIKHYVKQIFAVGDEQIKIGGKNETGHHLFFWPEGNISNLVITDTMLSEVAIYSEFHNSELSIYLIKP